MWYSINFQWVFGMQLLGVLGGGNQQSSWGFWIHLGRDLKKTFTKIKVTAGMTKPMVRDLAIEEAPHEDIKDTIEHNNQSYDE